MRLRSVTKTLFLTVIAVAIATICSWPAYAGYQIAVQTGNLPKSGTDARVFIQLFGGTRTSTELRLDNQRNNFELGRRDTFNVDTPSVGWIYKIRLFHDNRNDRPGWYVNFVEIKDNETGLMWHIDFNQWLALTASPYSTEAEIDVPVNNVSLSNDSILKNYYFGYQIHGGSNDHTSPQTINDEFTYQFQRRAEINLDSAVTMQTSAKLGGSFLEVISADFSTSVTNHISQATQQSEQETYTYKQTNSITLPPNTSFTSVWLIFGSYLTGKVYVEEKASFDYQQLVQMYSRPYTFAGTISEDEAVKLALQRLAGSTEVAIEQPSPAEKRILISERILQGHNPLAVEQANAAITNSIAGSQVAETLDRNIKVKPVERSIIGQQGGREELR